MTYDEIFEKAKAVIGPDNIVDYRPAVFSGEEATFFGGLRCCIPNSIIIWLKNGDWLMYQYIEK